MEDTTGSNVFDRLKIASNSASDAELAVNLKLTKQAIAQARAKKIAPASWIPKAAELFNVSTDWLFFGRGPMRFEEISALPDVKLNSVSAKISCSRCVKLEEKLECFEVERRELSGELREVNAENRRLLRENGDLRERCARLEARQAGCISAIAANSACTECA